MRKTLTILACLLATEASALSCLPLTPTMNFHQAAEAKESYVILHGKLDFDASLLPERVLLNPETAPPEVDIPARFTGDGLTQSGFSTRIEDRPITLQARCFGPWCASMQPNVDHLIFVEVEDGAYTLKIDPCGGNAFEQPTPAALRAITTCMQGGPCQKELVRR